MEWQLEAEDFEDYLESTTIVNWKEKSISELSRAFERVSTSKLDLLEQIYFFVRDQISHSADIVGKVVTCNASDVLLYKEVFVLLNHICLQLC